MMELSEKEITELDDYENRLRSIQTTMFDWTPAREWTAKDKKLFALCYWTILKKYLADRRCYEGDLNQRQLSIYLTSEERPDKKNIKIDPNFIAKLIIRNTFPSDELASRIEKYLPNKPIKKNIVILQFLDLPKEMRQGILLPFIEEESKKESMILKEIESMIHSLDEYQLRELRGYLAHMTGALR